MLVGVLIGNTCEAAADIGGMAAAVNIFVPVPIPWIAVVATASILALQIWGSYDLIRSIFRWLALSLFAYIIAAVLSRPHWGEVLKGTLLPRIAFNRESLSLLVAIIGTSLSAYIYTWQSNVEVEEEVEMGRTRLAQRQGATAEELRQSRRDIVWGMLFANVVMYFIILSRSALFHAGKHEINTATEAAQALSPIAGKAAGLLFAVGVVAVGFLAVPMMTTGAAYDLAQTAGWSYGLHKRPSQAREFYLAIVVISGIATALNFIGINPMKALVWAFLDASLMFLIMLLTNDRRVMGDRTNGILINILGWVTTLLIFAAAVGSCAPSGSSVLIDEPPAAGPRLHHEVETSAMNARHSELNSPVGSGEGRSTGRGLFTRSRGKLRKRKSHDSRSFPPSWRGCPKHICTGRNRVFRSKTAADPLATCMFQRLPIRGSCERAPDSAATAGSPI